jgi:predicted RNase H-like HicB family nuclease
MLKIMRNFTAIIEKAEESGYFAFCPEIKGANGQGETVEECCEDLKLAIQLIFEELREQAISNASSNVICQEIALS